MACTLLCPNCGTTLKEKGDEMKGSPGEYRVYDSLWNSAEKAGAHRRIECLACGAMGPVSRFDPLLADIEAAEAAEAGDGDRSKRRNGDAGEGASRSRDDEIARLRAALIPFARIWAMNDRFGPPMSAGVREYAAGVWPTMGDAKRAYDLVWAHRKPGE